MTCFHPLDAWQKDNGEVVFANKGSIRRELKLPCGRCIGCRLSRSRAWSIRCMHEAQMYDSSLFVTLTYDDSHYSPSLNYTDFQLFLKRLRKSKHPARLRFFVAGEYGALGINPHWHCLLFNCDFPDRRPIKKDLWRSPELERLWPYGFSSIGNVTHESAAYCAKYTLEKKTGPLAAKHYLRVDVRTGEIVNVVPEFAHMSLKPGLGYPWFVKYWKDVYKARDGVVVNGSTVPAPKYYDLLLERTDPDLRDWKDFTRYVKSGEFAADCTPERLADREAVAAARVKFHSEQSGVF